MKKKKINTHTFFLHCAFYKLIIQLHLWFATGLQKTCYGYYISIQIKSLFECFFFKYCIKINKMCVKKYYSYFIRFENGKWIHILTSNNTLFWKHGHSLHLLFIFLKWHSEWLCGNFCFIFHFNILISNLEIKAWLNGKQIDIY